MRASKLIIHLTNLKVLLLLLTIDFGCRSWSIVTFFGTFFVSADLKLSSYNSCRQDAPCATACTAKSKKYWDLVSFWWTSRLLFSWSFAILEYSSELSWRSFQIHCISLDSTYSWFLIVVRYTMFSNLCSLNSMLGYFIWVATSTLSKKLSAQMFSSIWIFFVFFFYFLGSILAGSNLIGLRWPVLVKNREFRVVPILATASLFTLRASSLRHSEISESPLSLETFSTAIFGTLVARSFCLLRSMGFWFLQDPLSLEELRLLLFWL